MVEAAKRGLLQPPAPPRAEFGTPEAAAAERGAFVSGVRAPVDAAAQLLTRVLEAGFKAVAPESDAAKWMQKQREEVERINSEAKKRGDVAVSQAPGGESSRTVGNIAGMIPMLAAMPARIAGSAVAGGAAAGAAGGALTPVQDTENFALEKAKQVGVGGVVGGAIGGIAGKVSDVIARRAAGSQSQAVKAAGSQAYDTAFAQDVTVSANSMQRLAANVRQRLTDFGVRRELNPRTMAAFDALEEAATQNHTLQSIDLLRRVVKNAANTETRADRGASQLILEEIDDFMTRIDASDLLTGNNATLNVAQTALQQARDLWARGSRGELVEEMIRNAGIRAGNFTGTGYENALRQEFTRLATNPRRMRLFPEEARTAIEKAAKGGPMTNALRWLGKFAPRGVVSAALGQALGNAVGGPVGGALLPIAGEVGRAGATASRDRLARQALEAMLGQQLPRGPASPFTGGLTGMMGAEAVTNEGRAR